MAMCDLMSGAHKKPDFLAVNPCGKIPALEERHCCCWFGIKTGVFRIFFKKVHFLSEPTGSGPIRFSKFLGSGLKKI